jgi:hypothetical protein
LPAFSTKLLPRRRAPAVADHQTLEVGHIDILFREIRGACSLLICAAENETHQLDAEGMYFVGERHPGTHHHDSGMAQAEAGGWR